MPSAPLRPLAAAAVFAVAGCSLTAPGDVSADAPSLPLLIATDLSADRAPAVGDTATLAASFRFVTPDDSVYSQFNESFLRRLDSLFVANETLLVEGEVRVYPPGRSDAASDVLRVVGRAMVSQRVRRDSPVRFSVPFRAVRAGRAVVQARVRVIADEGTPLEAELGGGADYECFEVGEGASASVGNCVSSASPRPGLVTHAWLAAAVASRDRQCGSRLLVRQALTPSLSQRERGPRRKGPRRTTI